VVLQGRSCRTKPRQYPNGDEAVRNSVRGMKVTFSSEIQFRPVLLNLFAMADPYCYDTKQVYIHRFVNGYM